MRLAVLADIHANLGALTAVLADVDARGADAVVCLGDVVGYGPDPEACVDRVRARCTAVVMGNHDAAVATGDGLDVLPADGAVAAEHHRAWLDADALAWLGGLPLAGTAADGAATLVHASPDQPAAWRRLDGVRQVFAQFEAFATPVCFVGHSHRPAVVSNVLGVTTVRPGPRYLINVGSVGQPRDRDPRAAYGLFDAAAMRYELVRVRYDTAQTAARVAARGLPPRLGSRLAEGV